MNFTDYKKLYDESIRDSQGFWAKQAESLTWNQKWTKVKDTSFEKPVSIKWYIDGELNASFNCIDRHLKSSSQKCAILFEPDHPDAPVRKITYQDLHDEVCRMANVLKKYGVQRGDRVTIYMPMIPEAVYAIHACNRIGAVHNVVFGGFAPDSISDRIIDCESTFVITADEGLRGGKKINLKVNVDRAIQKTPTVGKVLLIRHTGGNVPFTPGRDIEWEVERKLASPVCPPVSMNAEDPLFILYTSGSTGKPKGVLHSTGGYLVFTNTTFKYVFDYRPDDIFWCTADVGWVTGHSYIAYGPLSCGATVLMFEGVPNYPTVARFWEVIDKHKVTVLYTAPTAIRALMRESVDFVKKSSRKSLRLLGSVGEPINPEAWNWYHKNVGDGRLDIVDTWWQTETGGILISPIAGATPLKPGSATLPFFGIVPKLLTTEGIEIKGPGEGVLAIADSWPGQMRTVYKNHERFEAGYFTLYKGLYFTGDGCKRDVDGYYWITGRVDDVINVAGHRLGTAEIESALVSHQSVAEAAAVGYPHDIKGQGIYCYVTLKAGIKPSDELRKQLIHHVREEISAIAAPDLIQWAPGLPKTRSGKIMRRILRKIAENLPDQLGDISTLADPTVVDDIVKNRLNRG